jgi:hypothetical protein
MIEIIKKRHQDLITGLAELYSQKEETERQIATQRAAIYECATLIKAVEEKEADDGL